MRVSQAVTALLFVLIAVAVGQAFALPQAMFCAHPDPFGGTADPECGTLYISVFLQAVPAFLFWILFVAVLRKVVALLTADEGERLLWVVCASGVLTTIIFVFSSLPYRPIFLVTALPAVFVAVQDTAWRLESQRTLGKPYIAGIGWAFLAGASAYLITVGLVQWSPALAGIWWSAVVRFAHPANSLAAPAFFAGAIVALVAYLLKSPAKVFSPPDSVSVMVFFASIVVFGFAMAIWLQVRIPYLVADPLTNWTVRALMTPFPLALSTTLAGVCGLVGAIAAYLPSRSDALAVLVLGGPIASFSVSCFAREWLTISGDYPFTGDSPLPAALACLASSRSFWVYTLIGFCLALRFRLMSLRARWSPNAVGILVATIVVISILLSLHSETYDRFRFYIDLLRLREDFALIAVPLLIGGWFLPAVGPDRVKTSGNPGGSDEPPLRKEATETRGSSFKG
ncbi:MAG: hypothetical protein V2G42_03775 [bacterium JZ-2024 1]